ncbi:hypothetical protein OC842_006020 [Tilletia horrida]|uniref:Uncharacterized protein n=1 Tax=Tilletia horrida TaxID=155126 RepID=A0AAN6JIF8_9BASI|nr:hypothetical protein OC842_006020 [Tilletia horrida]
MTMSARQPRPPPALDDDDLDDDEVEQQTSSQSRLEPEDGEEQDDFDPGALDPGMFVPGLTPEQIAAIPLGVLRAHHPDLMKDGSEVDAQASSSKASTLRGRARSSARSDATADTQSARRMPPPVPGYQLYKISLVPPNGDESDVDAEAEPTRSRESLTSPQWTRADAAAIKETFGKLDCTVYEDGTRIRKDDKLAIETAMRLMFAFLWTMDVGDDLEDEKRNYRFWLKNFGWLLVRMAKKLELQFPILGWCENHYKALKWIEMFIKSHNQMVTEKERKRAVKKKQKEMKRGGQVSSSRTTKAAAIASKTKGKRKARKLDSDLDSDAPDDDEEEEEYEDEDEDESPRKKRKNAQAQIPRKAMATAVMKTKACSQAKSADDDKNVFSEDDDLPPVRQRNQNESASSGKRRANPGPSAFEADDWQGEERSALKGRTGEWEGMKNATSSHASSSSAARDLERMPKSLLIPKKDAFPSQIDGGQLKRSQASNKKAASAAITKQMQHSALADGLSDSDKENAASSLPSKLGKCARQSSSSASTAYQMKYTPASSRGLIMPSSSLLRSATPGSSAVAAASSVERLGTSVASFKTDWSCTSLSPNVATIRDALSRFSDLEEVELVRSALTTLDTAQSCGIDPKMGGDEDFLKWVEDLEDLTVTEEADEDELGGQFGHRAIGRWTSWHTALADISIWGNTRNACRLLAALLRAWAMARAQMEQATPKQTGDPLIHNHIGEVCQLIESAFGLPQAQKKAKKAATGTTQGETIMGEASSSQAAAQTIESQAAPQTSKASGKVSEARMRRLGQKRAIKILDLADIVVQDKRKALDMLISAWQNGTVTLTPTQIGQAELNKPIEGSVTPAAPPKSKRKPPAYDQ